MDINKFKEKLHEGIVEFTYVKRDGTERLAHGTLSDKAVPKGNSKAKYKVHDIKWNVDGDTTLPESLTAEIDTCLSGDCTPEDYLYDYLHEHYGFSAMSFKAEKAVRHKSKTAIRYYDTDKLAWRSFDESQLLSYEGM